MRNSLALTKFSAKPTGPGGKSRRPGGWPDVPQSRLLEPTLRFCQVIEPLSELLELPLPDQGSRPIQSGFLVGQRGQGCRSIHGRDQAVEAQCLSLRWKAPCRKRTLERSRFAQNARGSFLADASCVRNPVRRVAAQGDEVGHLPRINPVTLAHLRGTNPHHFTRAHRLQDGRRLGRELIRIAAAGCDDQDPPSRSSCTAAAAKKIVRLVTGSLGRREATRCHKLRQHGQLIDKVIVEVAAGLIALKRFVPVSRGIERIPADQKARGCSLS